MWIFLGKCSERQGNQFGSKKQAISAVFCMSVCNIFLPYCYIFHQVMESTTGVRYNIHSRSSRNLYKTPLVIDSGNSDYWCGWLTGNVAMRGLLQFMPLLNTHHLLRFWFLLWKSSRTGRAPRGLRNTHLADKPGIRRPDSQQKSIDSLLFEFFWNSKNQKKEKKNQFRLPDTLKPDL